MSAYKTSLSSRYLKARLKPFTRPLFLGSLGMISFFGFCVWQYWQHPEWRSTGLNQTNSVTNNTDPQLNGDEFAGVYLQGIPTPVANNANMAPSNIEQPGFLERWLEQKRAETMNSYNQPFVSVGSQPSNNQNKFKFSTEELLRQPALQQYRSVMGNSQPATESENTAVNNQERPEVSSRFPVPATNSGQPTVLEAAIARINYQRSSGEANGAAGQGTNTQLQAQNVPGYTYTQPHQPPTGYTWGVTPPSSRQPVTTPTTDSGYPNSVNPQPEAEADATAQPNNFGGAANPGYPATNQGFPGGVYPGTNNNPYYNPRSY